MRAVILLLLHSRKFWWYLLLTSSRRHNDVICCQRYTECLVTTLSNRTVYRHTAPRTCKIWTVASRNAKLSCVQPPNTRDLSFVDYQIWAVMQHLVYHRQIHSVDELKRRRIHLWCSLEQSIFDEAIDQWQGRHRACVRAKGGHFEYSLWTDNVDFVHICYIQCDLFDCCIFNYEVMPATSDNTFFYKVVHYQIWGMVVDFKVYLVGVNCCLQQWKIIKNVQYLLKVMLKWIFWLTV